MYSFDLLEKGCYYLIKEKCDDEVQLIKIGVITDQGLFIQYCNDEWTTKWKLKKDELFDIIECLSDDAVKSWETQFYEGTDAFQENEDDD
jgi:hypothetical protein